jgi:hypothetical protein
MPPISETALLFDGSRTSPFVLMEREASRRRRLVGKISGMIAQGPPPGYWKNTVQVPLFPTIKSYTDCAGIEPRLRTVDLATSSVSHVTVWFVPIGACCMWKKTVIYFENHMVHKHKLREQNGQF